MKKIVIAFFILTIGINSLLSQVRLLETPPKSYVVYRAADSITTDGKLDEESWQNIPWTEDFQDIEGSLKPDPHYRTRVKMLWDENYFYIAAQLEEPHIWATFTERESIIFHENNFEVFIDPSGDTHNYYELEINALGTIWDLMLTKPYRNGGLPISAWDVRGFKYGIHKEGTINDPSDVDKMWTVEMAFPWNILAESAPAKRKPSSGEYWRVNFSRVQWKLDIVNGEYQKRVNPETGKPYPEYNWVWSPQWAIDMHRPELWGYALFSDIKAGEGTQTFKLPKDEKVKFILRELYYKQHNYKRENNKFAQSLKELNPKNKKLYKFIKPKFDIAKTRFKISAPTTDKSGKWHITEDSKIWRD
ncbi:carbohydrate-binding family 9-like protein [Marinilabiliaceae bacterium ANBcel2]|nr:carbohydrate-binding family 9-like protein [Marinilabiliaceae bacterium ANBcel2]